MSWHNPHFKTPNMEQLSKEGVRLSKSYVTPKCSPSRAALLTGTYPWRFFLSLFSISSIPVLTFLPWRLGLQRGAIERFQATGLDPNKVLLPELLQKGGYDTHLVNQLCLFNMF